MKYGIRKNWLAVFEIMIKHPVIILPFIFIAFLESLMLEIVYFSTRIPISFVANPIIRKLFGEEYLHYPSNLVLLPKLFYYLQVVIYVLLVVFLTAVTVNIFKNIKARLPIKIKALTNNAFKRYGSFVVYGILMTFLIVILQKLDSFIFLKLSSLISKRFTDLPPIFYSTLFLLLLFFSNIILQALFVLTIPIIVLEKKSFFRAVIASIALGVRNIFKIFALIFLPFLVYLPVLVLKSDPTKLMYQTFPEVTVLVTALGIIIAVFADSFIILCASQFLTDMEKK